MNKEEIIKVLEILTPQERKDFVVVASAALVLNGVIEEARDVDMSTRTSGVLQKARIRRGLVFNKTPITPGLRVMHLSEHLEVGFHPRFNEISKTWIRDKYFKFKETPEGFQYLSLFGCRLWYRMAVNTFGREKDQQRFDLVNQAWDRYMAEVALERKRLRAL